MATGTATALVWTNAQDLSVALPELSRDLDASLDELQWTISAFMLAGGALILATGAAAKWLDLGVDRPKCRCAIPDRPGLGKRTMGV